MLKMTFMAHNSPTYLEVELNNFVNDNIVEMLRVTIDHMVEGILGVRPHEHNMNKIIHIIR